MYGCFVVAASIQIYSAAAPVFNFRSTTKQRGVAIALSLAASLVGSPAFTQTANVPNPRNEFPDEVAKTRLQRDSDPAKKFRRRRLKPATLLVDGSALAQSASLSTAKRYSADELVKTRTQNEIDPSAKFENLREKGMWLNIPGPADTIDQDQGGARSALADVGIGYVGGTVNSLVDNQFPNAARTSIANQRYMGQNPTFSTVNFMIVTYDLSRLAFPMVRSS
ncbi:hypothetical protein [Bradyrhizobium neotropicale]|uniref:hypothetical protein n=1 Tax=Bradyrhizobium neotropicale TaxID=1497615 RepID=UPI001FEE0922|nr:hypothetical protein [Bradyrhizobium neotropicale]